MALEAWLSARWRRCRATGRILLDMNPDRGMTDRVRRVVKANGDRLTTCTAGGSDPAAQVSSFPALSHLTLEVARAA